jgi:hypothetical protein
MNTDRLLEKLFAAARKNTENTQVPVFFEKRIMHLIRQKPKRRWTWTTLLRWNILVPAASLCVVILAVGIYFQPKDPGQIDFENEVLSLNYDAN